LSSFLENYPGQPYYRNISPEHTFGTRTLLILEVTDRILDFKDFLYLFLIINYCLTYIWFVPDKYYFVDLPVNNGQALGFIIWNQM
jgi:hypothetical protein